MERHIVGLGGGGDTPEQTRLLYDFVLELTGKERPKHMWVPTAILEDPSGFGYFHDRFGKRCEVTNLRTFPWPPDEEPKSDPRVKAIAQAARDLVARRRAWLNPTGASEQELKKRTLTNLYNQRPEWLALAHRKLDEAVLDAYGWPHDLADEEILSRLLALNLERSRAPNTN